MTYILNITLRWGVFRSEQLAARAWRRVCGLRPTCTRTILSHKYQSGALSSICVFCEHQIRNYATHHT